jgi:hypothetical protein
MWKTLKPTILFLSLLMFSAGAQAITIQDNYIGSDSHGLGDIIGVAAYFDVNRMEVDFQNGTLTVDIYSRYFNNIGQYNTQLGDLFISTNGWQPSGSAPYAGDNASNGGWELALVLDSHSADSGTLSLYTVNPANIVSSFAPGYIFRNGQEVQYNPAGQEALTSGLWSISGLDTLGDSDDYLRLQVTYGDWGVTEALGFHWGMTCANDVIEGAAPVPEPATMLLLGTGLIGLAGLGRRKFKKK